MPDSGDEKPGTPDLEAEVERVVADSQHRTLDEMRGKFSQLIYLASLRDHNTGCYSHYGLETRYSAEGVNEGLRRCHAKVFEELVALSLEEQTQELIRFFESQGEDRSRLVRAWERLRPYQILPPETCHPLARELFSKNVELILKILRETELWPLLHDPHGNSDDLA